ncbi:MAG: ATP-binding protein [Elusimicrobiota bacterium]|nr:ATP-binding protein [Elusimicrobiota bacterium]
MKNKGKLKIGSSWNAITIIALSQSNPLKAVAEFVENSIDAKARNISVIRGKKKGEHYLKVVDDGEGIPLNNKGVPDFKYVATHICDSIKKKIKEDGAEGVQGEYGIGLLSFWTVGGALSMVSSGADGNLYEMNMKKGEPDYTIRKTRRLFPEKGTSLKVSPILSGIRQLSGKKIQRYLSSELRDRIRKTGVNIRVVDRRARKEFKVKPRKYEGRIIHGLPDVASKYGDIYTEIYINKPDLSNRVALYRRGTRVLRSVTELPEFDVPPWNSDYLQGMIDAPFLHLTPGTRSGIIRDERYEDVCRALRPAGKMLIKMIEEQKKAEEERASRQIMKSIRKALMEAMLTLPAEEYDWFDVKRKNPKGAGAAGNGMVIPAGENDKNETRKEFFEYPGPLYSVVISPASTLVKVEERKNLIALARDNKGRAVEGDLNFSWKIIEGKGSLEDGRKQAAVFIAPSEPQITVIKVTACQGKKKCGGEAVITVTDQLIKKEKKPSSDKGLPGYTYHRAPGELWRSKYDKKTIWLL